MARAGQTISQVVLHMGVAFGVMYAMTGSIAFGGIAALIEPICNVALLPLHDKLWARLRKRQSRAPGERRTALTTASDAALFRRRGVARAVA